MGHAAGNRHATSLASLLLFLCLSTHVSTTVSETWNDRPLAHRYRRGLDERSRSRRFIDQDRGLESREQDTSQVIIEEPDDRNDDDGDDMMGDSGQGRVRRRGTKRAPDPSVYQDIVSPWEPPLFEWIYNPALQRRNERYYKQQGGERRDGDGAETNTDTDSARSQSLTSSTIRRSFPRNQNYPGRLKNYPRQTRPPNRPPQPLTRSQQQSLSPQGHNVLPQPVGQISKLQPYSAIQGSYTARKPNPPPDGNVSPQTRGHNSPALPPSPASFQGSSAARRLSPTSHNVAPAASSQYLSATVAGGGLAARPVSGDSLGSRASGADRNQLSPYRNTLSFSSASVGESQGVASGAVSSSRGFPAQSSSGLPQQLPPSPLVQPQAATASSSPDAQSSRPPQGSDAVTSPQQHRNDVRTWPQAGDGKRSVLPEPQTRRVGGSHAGVTVGSRGASSNADVTATDESACRVQLTVCQSNERNLRALQNTYQDNLVRLKTLIADAVDRFIEDPTQPLDSAVCSPRRPDQPTSARATGTPDPTGGHSDVTRDGHSVVTVSVQDHRKPQVYGSSSYDDDEDDEDDVIVDVVEHDGGMSGQPGEDVGSAVQTVTEYPPANNNEVDDEDTVTMVHSGIIDLDNSRINHHHTVISQDADNDLDDREGRDPANHFVSSSRQQNGDQRIANVPSQSHQQGQETTTRVEPTDDRREFGLPSGEDDIILTDSGKTLLGQAQLGNKDEISKSGSGTGDGSGTGVHFDDLKDLDEAETERDNTQQRMWETWRQRNQNEREDRPQERRSQENQQEKVGGCSLGDWTEWAGPVGFGVIERRRFVVDGKPECSQKAKDADLVMRVDIAVFNANHTYYKPPEEVGQDFESDFTRSYVPRDLLLILDASGSIEVEDFELIRQGVAVMIDLFCGGFGMEPSNNRLAVIMFASDIKIIHRFSDDQAPNTLRDVIANMTQPNGNTCTGDALKLAHGVIFTPENGSRPDVVHDTLLLTDGHSNCGEVTVQEGAQLLRSVSNIFALGVGIANDTEARWELNSVVSNNEPRHIFSLERYEDFKDMTRSIHERQKTVPCLPIVDSKPKQDN